MAAKQLLFSGASVPDLWFETTSAQREALALQLAAYPGCAMQAWQRTPKGWINAEIALPNEEFYKFRVNHRAVVTNARIERAPDSASAYQKRAMRDPIAHREALYRLYDKRHARKDLFESDI